MVEKIPNAEEVYNSFMNDKSLADSWIEEARECGVDFSDVTVATIRKEMEETKDMRFDYLVHSVRPGLAMFSDAFKKIFAEESKSDASQEEIISIINDEPDMVKEIFDMAKYVGTNDNLYVVCLKHLEEQEEKGCRFNPEEKSYNGDMMTFAFAAHCLGKIRENAENAKSVILDTEELALKKWIQEVSSKETTDRETAISFVDYCLDKEKFIKDYTAKVQDRTQEQVVEKQSVGYAMEEKQEEMEKASVKKERNNGLYDGLRPKQKFLVTGLQKKADEKGLMITGSDGKQYPLRYNSTMPDGVTKTASGKEVFPRKSDGAMVSLEWLRQRRLDKFLQSAEKLGIFKRQEKECNTATQKMVNTSREM